MDIAPDYESADLVAAELCSFDGIVDPCRHTPALSERSQEGVRRGNRGATRSEPDARALPAYFVFTSRIGVVFDFSESKPLTYPPASAPDASAVSFAEYDTLS